MAAACNVVEDESSTSISNDLLEAQIVAQAITELQEIQGPVVQHVTTGDSFVSVVSESGLDSGSVDTSGQTQTQVIYYIEDGTVARTEDRTLVDSSVQANDYEIERRSGRVPSRKRVIPVKFRDYKHTSDDDTSDSDYNPYDSSPRPRKTSRTVKTDSSTQSTSSLRPAVTRGRQHRVGRPRKNFMPTHTVGGEVISVPVAPISLEVAQKYQEALKLSREDEVERKYQLALKEADSRGIEDQGSSTEAGKPESKDAENNDLDQTVKSENDEMGESSGIGKADGSENYPVRLLKRGRGRPRKDSWERSYKCPDCGKKFNQKGNLRVHLRVHTSERPFPCQEEGCGKSFRSNESLRRHLLSHQGIKPFVCELCEHRFSSNVALTEHRSRHFDQKPHACPHCQRRFRQVSCLRRHITTHSGEMRFMCTICKRCFAQSSYLKSHMKVHTGEKPFKCELCDKRFAHQSDVKRHRTTHTGEKPYACTKCQARFSDVSSKNRHEREHESNKRYTCQMCSDTFKRPGQLMSHLRRKHSHTFPVKLEKDGSTGAYTFSVAEEGEPGAFHVNQQKLVSLIKNLHSKTVTGTDGFTEIGNISVIGLSDTVNQSEDAMASDHVTDISNLEKEVDASVIESDMSVPIELQGVEIQGEEAGQTFIAITDLADSLSTVGEKGTEDKQTECRYRIVYEITEDGQQKQILVPYNPAEEVDGLNLQVQYTQLESQPSVDTIIDGTATMDEVQEEKLADTNAQTESGQAADTITAEEQGTVSTDQIETQNVESVVCIEDGATGTMAVETQGENTESGSVTDVDREVTDAGVDYVNNPDFSSQDYYNWLTNFTELCKVVPMPLDVSVFQKISHVHKTLSDVMATPSGVVADRENFRVLMNISRELSAIINEHLIYVLENLNPEEKAKKSSAEIEITNI